jgi:predicted RNA-binding protein with RPS1 domain
MEVFKKNDEVEAEVIDIDKTNQRISLGIKQLSDDPWKNIDEKYKILVTWSRARSRNWPVSVRLFNCRTTSTVSSTSHS